MPRVFISYSTEEKEVAGDVKRALGEIELEAFLAHEDLDVSEEWRDEIVRELRACDVFVALLSKAFRASNWAPQELGFIVTRPEVVIVPVSLDGTMPYGFISHIQGKRFPATGVSAEFFLAAIAKRHPHKVIPGLIRRVANAGGFRHAEAVLKPLVPFFAAFTPEEAEQLADAAISNSQVWSAGRCRGEYLPEFLRLQSHSLPAPKLRALTYQVENDAWYPGDP